MSCFRCKFVADLSREAKEDTYSNTETFPSLEAHANKQPDS